MQHACFLSFTAEVSFPPSKGGSFAVGEDGGRETRREKSFLLRKSQPPLTSNIIKLAVIANQRARWCGNLPD